MAVIIEYLVNKLKDAASEEINFQLEFNNEIEELINRLKSFQCLLEYTCERKQNTSLAKERVKQLRETAFYTEDVLEEFMLEMELLESNMPSNFCELKSTRGIMIYFIKKAWLRFQFHQQLKGIKRKLEFQEGEQEKYQTLTVEREDTSRLPIGSHHRMENVEIVGMDDEVAELRDLVEQPRDHMLVITVWGAGGSGKTTLVKKVYERVQMDKEIDCYAWVYVKQSCSILEILRAMVKGFSTSTGIEVPKEVDKMGENDLRESISKILKQKRYVLILDDVWDSEILKQFGLPVEKMSSIIVTSRQKTVALGSFLGVAQQVLNVKPLNRDLSWELFCKMAFCNSIPRGICPNNLMRLAQELVKICNGLPLAILAIAQLMATKGNDPRKWNNVIQDFDSELQGDLAGLNRVLLLSYYHLPTYLKPCFLYCAMFRKSDLISLNKLIRLWIAEGFITGEGGKTLEAIAREYFDELINRSMLQFRYESKGVQMHDLLRDVAVHMIEEENFGMLLKEKTTELNPTQRRLAIHTVEPKVQLGTCKLQLRSLLASHILGWFSSFPQMLQNIKLIRTMDLEGVFEIDNVPDEVGDLIHLRYLSLRWNTLIEDLPDSIKKLRHLQTLDIRGTQMDVAPGIAELKQLRHLLIGEYKEMPDISFEFTQLQSLDGVHLNLNQARELTRMLQLSKLNISAAGEESWREICFAIGKMTNLRTLNLRPCRSEFIQELSNLSASEYLEKLTLDGVVRLPNFIVSHNSLREITLSNGALLEDSFTTLGQLPRLRFLKLSSAYQGEQLVCESDSFPELEEFHIISAANLTTWNQIPKGSMKRLRKITIKSCMRLEMLPDGLQKLKNLQTLRLLSMEKEFVQRIDIGGPDHAKTRNISKILLKSDLEFTDSVFAHYYMREEYREVFDNYLNPNKFLMNIIGNIIK